MRDSRSLATRRRRLRRATLALMLLAGTSVLAEPSYAQQPQNATLRMMPPLPLKSIDASNQVQSNPFCQTPRQQGGVQLASGTTSTPVKLKPVGTAVGLQKIAPTQSAPAAISIGAPVASAVQANPMVASPAIQTSAESPLGQPRTSIRLVRPNTQQQTPVQAVQQAGIPTPQAAISVPPAPIAQPIARAIVKGSIGHAPTAATPQIPTRQRAPIAPMTEAAEAARQNALMPADQPAPPPTDSAEADSTDAASNDQGSTSVASILKANPNPKQATPVEESEPIFFSFSDKSDTTEPDVVESHEDTDSDAAKVDESNAPLPAAVRIAEPINTLPQSAPRSVLQKVEQTTEGGRGFAAVKIAHPNIRAVANPFVDEQSSDEPAEQLDPELSNVDTEQLANQEPAVDDEISVLKFDPPVILAEAPGMTGEFVDPIQLDEEETDELDSVPNEGTSVLATTEDEASEPSVERSVSAPIQDVMKSDNGEPIAIYRTEPAVAKPVPQGEETLHSKRYRPPVAVKQVPIDFERKDLPTVEPAFVKAAVHPVPQNVASKEPAPEIKIDSLGVELGPEVKLTPLHMNQAQVRSLTLGGSVTDVRVGDKDICQAFASGPNQLKLIGTGQGVTRLVVWAAPDGENQKTLMRAFEIHVGDVAPTEGESVADTVHLLNSSIQRAFPNCRANVELIRGELHVVGQCDNQESAKKIIRMVRKSCLIPVRDQLSVQ